MELTKKQKRKQKIWKYLYPIYGSKVAQKCILKLHWLWYKAGRQQYHLGYMAQGITALDLEKELANKWGFEQFLVAWVDKGQVATLRKRENFNFQYHLRIFSDGELRGHYEYTPESKPFAHLFEVNEENRLEDFKKFLGNALQEGESVRRA